MAPAVKSGKSAAAAAPAGAGKKFRKAVNFDLGGGIMRYSRNQQYARKALWVQKAAAKPKVAVPKKPITVVKKIGGAKNGGERVVSLQKKTDVLFTKERVSKRPAKGTFSQHKRNTRKSIVPGRIVILLAGKHKGKRVVVLKVLQSGLLLINGPFSLNSCPLRRVSQRYVIATQTRVKLDKVVIPEHINDLYFRRQLLKNQNRGEGDIFAAKKPKYVATEQRRADQAAVDKAVRQAISTHKDKRLLFSYLRSYFALSSSQYPHRLRF